MSTIVCKFGGTSTAGAERFREILTILRASPSRRCVVLSAPGRDDRHEAKVTELLERCWEVRNSPAALNAAMLTVAERYEAIALPLGLPSPREQVCREIESAVRISRDQALSRGEYLCAQLFSRFSGFPMLDAARVIRFYTDGTLDEAGTLSALSRFSDARDCLVLPGFYGADPLGNIHTFPRNGSDITGALAAAGLGADLYENWTDVPGLMTADPNDVPDARLIPQISYRQMRAFARAGAQVLHPACLDPVALAGIPTRLRQTGRPGCFGTLIDDRCGAEVPCIASLDRVPLPGVPGAFASRITLFGVNRGQAMEAARQLSPIAALPGTDRSTWVYVQPERRKDCVRGLHKAVIEKHGDS